MTVVRTRTGRSAAAAVAPDPAATFQRDSPQSCDRCCRAAVGGRVTVGQKIQDSPFVVDLGVMGKCATFLGVRGEWKGEGGCVCGAVSECVA